MHPVSLERLFRNDHSAPQRYFRFGETLLAENSIRASGKPQCDRLHAAAGRAICYATKPPDVQPTVAAVPPVQARSAFVPAVQSRPAVEPAEQSAVGESEAPGTQAATTELPVVQNPDPLAISPKGTRIGDSYFDFPLTF